MADQYVSMKNIRHLLYEVHQVEELFGRERFQDYDKDSVNIFLDAVKDFADTDFFPYFQEMDADPVRYEDGKIVVHPQIGVAMQKGGEMGLIGSHFDYEHGGLQQPKMVHAAAYHILDCANNNVSGYLGLDEGAAKLITSFASDELIEQYVPKMIAGKWGGTMCLTEPQAGSSLSDVVTSATPQGDGTYKIKGQKIFISAGDHEYVENTIHLLLARIDGAPSGTKGISLFIVPKNRIKEDGSLESNDVITAGDFQKMGQRGYATTHLVFGESDDCTAYLVGEEHRGLKYMFQMMNGARIAVGLHATSMATAAYYASLQYAKERPQGRRISNAGQKDVSQEQTLIINHPDVRRMLLLQKAVVEGALSLVMEVARYEDLEKTSEGEEKEKWNLLLEVLTPIAKTYPSEMGLTSISNGLQILGGYGFCTDFPLQQYYRDIRITSLYEGTTGIQSLDLLGRKMTLRNGKGLQLLVSEIQQTIEAAMTFDDLKPYAKKLIANLELNQKVLGFLIPFAMKGEHERFLSDATIFMDLMSTTVMAWQWLKLATVAKQKLVMGNGEQQDEFYESKIHTMKFFYKYELTKTSGLAETIMSDEVLTVVEEKELIS
ncbi:MAG: acyl-CoA dehydrogenase [Bacteroidota bacterium]